MPLMRTCRPGRQRVKVLVRLGGQRVEHLRGRGGAGAAVLSSGSSGWGVQAKPRCCYPELLQRQGL
jgi:hypothetical protein